MKICILSMQRVQNYGSVLQSYALKQMLEEIGHSVEFLEIEPNIHDNKLLDGAVMHFPDEELNTRGVLKKLKKIDRYFLDRVRHKCDVMRQNQIFTQFRRLCLEISTTDNDRHYDYCIIGSDEVFNCLSVSPWGFTSQLFGNVRQADKVITYAASCGSTVYECLPELVRQRIIEVFQRVSAFSVRDANTKMFVSQLSDRATEEHLDPVMVASFDKEIDEAKLPDSLPERYCILYSYQNRFHEESDIKRIKAFCKEYALKLVTVGSPQMWIKNHLVLTPFEALKVFQNATFVITDTFHGTIFSAKYAKRFAVMIRDSNRNKLGNLIKKLSLEKHLIDTTEQLAEVCRVENDLERTNSLSRSEREKSLQYLAANIK